MAGIIAWILVSGAAIFLFALYWRATGERNHLTCYIGIILLDDEIRAVHKQSLEKFLLEATVSDAQALSTVTLSAIQNISERLAAGDGSPGASSVLGFQALMWNRKKELERKPCE